MSSGAAIYAMQYLPSARDGTVTSVLKEREIVFYRDGPSATVAVVQSGGISSLSVNGKVDASNYAADMPTQIMLGHLPLLLHRHPRDVLVIGLGSGITAGAVARHPIERLDVVEIEPAVVEASRYFTRENHDVLRDRRARLIVADARNFLLTAPGDYDVITSEPSNPWIGGVATLFSREFFALARERLRPGGVMVQWVHGYSLAPEDLGMIVATFRSVFPATSLWQVAPGDYLLVGRATGRAPRPRRDQGSMGGGARISRGLPADALRRLAERAGVLSARRGGRGAHARRSAQHRRLARPRVLRSSRPAARHDGGELSGAGAPPHVASCRRSPPRAPAEIERAEAQYAIGLVPYSQRRWTDALDWFRRAMELNADYMPPVLMAAEASLRLGRASDALAFAQTVLSREPQNADALFVAGQAAAIPRDAGARRWHSSSKRPSLRPDDEAIRQALRRLTPARP